MKINLDLELPDYFKSTKSIEFFYEIKAYNEFGEKCNRLWKYNYSP